MLFFHLALAAGSAFLARQPLRLLAGIAWAAWLASAGLAPWLGVAAAALLALRAAFGLSRHRPRTSVRALGFTEIGFGLVSVLLLARGVRRGW